MLLNTFAIGPGVGVPRREPEHAGTCTYNNSYVSFGAEVGVHTYAAVIERREPRTSTDLSE